MNRPLARLTDGLRLGVRTYFHKGARPLSVKVQGDGDWVGLMAGSYTVAV